MDPIQAYHEASKHRLDRYAPGPGMLDWASQPDPFRRYAGAPVTELPLLAGDLPLCWDALFQAEVARPQALNTGTLACLLQLSLGLSAWKSYGGNRWSLRCNPSSGNLHPTEGYLICPELPSAGFDTGPAITAGVHHYRPDQHSLERRAAAPFAWSGGVLLALTGVHWREAWKYGMRAFRYCQHDCGHALAALAYAAALLGWQTRLLSAWSDDEINALTGIERATDPATAVEREAPEALLWIGPGVGSEVAPDAAQVLELLAGAEWTGKADALSSTHRAWPEIADISAATANPGGAGETSAASGAFWRDAETSLPRLAPVSRRPVSQLIAGRRSALAFDAVTGISTAQFYRMLDALLPRRGQPPWALWPDAPCVHPVLFVHRVDALPAGIYCLPRTPAALADLRAAMRPDWLWARVAACPAHLPLYLLAPLDVREFAATTSCHQDIAADSAFALAMLARYDDIGAAQPMHYRQRLWEAGMLGQVLYLEAEAAGVQATGIGCYFDDMVHHALGLDTTRFQDLYHFTVGKAVVDQRLGTQAAYAHLPERGSWPGKA